jgi:hypothetical protein
MLLTSACVAAHPRATVQAFSLGKQMDALREGEWPHELFTAVAWLAIAVGVILGIVGLINEVRALATLQCGAKGLLSTMSADLRAFIQNASCGIAGAA